MFYVLDFVNYYAFTILKGYVTSMWLLIKLDA